MAGTRGRPRQTNLGHAQQLTADYASWMTLNQNAFEPSIRIIDGTEGGGGQAGSRPLIDVIMPANVSLIDNILHDRDDPIPIGIYQILFQKYFTPAAVSRYRHEKYLRWLKKRL